MPGQPHNYSLHTQRQQLYVIYILKLIAHYKYDSPSLERNVTIIYYFPGCLYYIGKALEKDHCYTKALVLKEKIFEEQPCLKRDTMQMFMKWWNQLTFLICHLLYGALCLHLHTFTTLKNLFCFGVDHFQRHVDSLCRSGRRRAQIHRGGGTGDKEAQAGSLPLWTKAWPCPDSAHPLPLVSCCLLFLFWMLILDALII